MAIVFKLILPIVFIFFAAKGLAKVIRIAHLLLTHNNIWPPSPADKRGKTSNHDQVIDLCPECGKILGPHHKCPDNH